jgi:hypothetical protein
MDLASIQLSPELFKPIIEQHIKNAMAAALGDPTKAIEAIVNQCLSQKVDSSGRVSNSSYDNKHNFMDIVFRNMIQEVTKVEITKWAAENTEIIRNAIVKQISTKKGIDSFAKAMIDGVVKCMENTYKVHVEMNFKSE